MGLDKYMDWLVDYIYKNQEFDTVYSCVLNLSADTKNIKKLESLYNLINEYLLETYKLPIDSLNGVSYVLRYNTFHNFFIGNDGETIFCRGVSNNFSHNFIDYYDVKMYYLNKYEKPKNIARSLDCCIFSEEEIKKLTKDK